jgi:hypothetical protein
MGLLLQRTKHPLHVICVDIARHAELEKMESP